MDKDEIMKYGDRVYKILEFETMLKNMKKGSIFSIKVDNKESESEA
jgi:TusA-related sulfurtransferase